MPNLTCACGNLIDEAIVPAEGEFFFFESERWDAVVTGLSEAVLDGSFDSELLAERLSDALAASGRYFYRCGRCAGLMVSRGDGGFDYFEPSSGRPSAR